MFKLGARVVGGGAPCVIIGEVAQGHDGRIEAAHALIDAIADAGADAVKFQTHIAAAESTAAEPFRVPMAARDASRYDYWTRMEFSEARWREMAAHAQRRGVIFLSSPFSPEAMALLQRVGVPAWKVASGELSNGPMVRQMIETGLPMLVSTGMSPLAEIDQAVAWFRQHRVPYLIFQSTSTYPCPPERLGLNMLAVFRERYHCSVGLSDHSGTLFAGLAAATLGIDMLEVHVTLGGESAGPDAPASLTAGELAQLVEGVRFIEAARRHPVDKDRVADELAPMRRLFCKSVVARVDLDAGTVLERGHLAGKKPGTGVPVAEADALLGRRLRRAVKRDECLQWQDLV